ncbi:MAG: diguanylate cyclase [Methylovirgula sp.]
MATRPLQSVRPPALPLLYRGRWIFASAILCIICISGLVGFAIYDSYRSTERLAIQSSETLEALIDEDISREIDALNLSLQAVVDGFLNPKIMALEPSLRQETLFDRSATAQGLGSILVLDEDGAVVLDSRRTPPPKINLADRDYFQVQKNNPNVGLYVSRPFQSRLASGVWMIAISRRLSKPDGAFAGVVAGSIQLSYFDRLLANARWAQNASIMLTNEHGVLIARYPPLPSFVGHALPSLKNLYVGSGYDLGTFRARGLDGMERIYSSYKIAGLPLVITAGVSARDLFADWEIHSLIICLSLAALSTVILILAARTYQELRRRVRFEAELEALATTDKLTGIANRRQFDERFSTEWSRAARDSSALSVLLIDVDAFKSYNDGFGHQAGDIALSAVAKCLQSKKMRVPDFIARYGGEEFAALLPNTDELGALYVAEQMRLMIETLDIAATSRAASKVTISIGAATARPREGGEPMRIILEADRALYAAKASGRNRVCAAGMSPNPLKLSA